MTTNEEQVKKHQEIIRQQISAPDWTQRVAMKTLETFGHRYFDHPSTVASPRYGVISVEAVEIGIKDAIKNPAIKSQLLELIKTLGKDEKPKIIRSLEVDLNNYDRGVVACQATISFGYPEADQTVCKKQNLEFAEALEYRNRLARVLEEVCELF